MTVQTETNPIVREAGGHGETLIEWFDEFDTNPFFREAAESDFTPAQIAEARALVST